MASAARTGSFSPNRLRRWACTNCSYAYDPQRGDETQGIEPGRCFESLPAAWHCPWCGADKSLFEPEPEQ